jgi:hypothetical protein
MWPISGSAGGPGGRGDCRGLLTRMRIRSAMRVNIQTLLRILIMTRLRSLMSKGNGLEAISYTHGGLSMRACDKSYVCQTVR